MIKQSHGRDATVNTTIGQEARAQQEHKEFALSTVSKYSAMKLHYISSIASLKGITNKFSHKPCMDILSEFFGNKGKRI